jgi:hypothetical protein
MVMVWPGAKVFGVTERAPEPPQGRDFIAASRLGGSSSSMCALPYVLVSSVADRADMSARDLTFTSLNPRPKGDKPVLPSVEQQHL